MDSHSILTVLIMVILVLLSAYFSATETAFSTLNRNRLKSMSNKGNKRASKTLMLFEDFDNLLSTILVGNNIVNIALASISTMFFVSKLGDGIGATVSTVVITLIVLVFGEITPKSLAKEEAESFAMFVSPTILLLEKILTPVNYVFMLWKKFVSKIFISNKSKKKITDEELLTMVDEATSDGGIDRDERELIRNAIEFTDLKASDILTPRTHIKAIQKNASKDKITQAFMESEFSRLPVYDENLDDIIGVLHYKDFMSGVCTRNESVESQIKEVQFINPSMRIRNLMQMLQKDKRHLVVVTDEYGGTEGIVTMEDILEELVGEIFDESDERTNYIQQLDENTYLINALADLDDVFEMLNIYDKTESNTVGGWVNEHLQALAKVGDSFNTGRVNVLVTEADKSHAVEIKLTVKSKEKAKINK